MTMTLNQASYVEFLTKYEVWPTIALSASWEKHSDEELLRIYQTGHPLESNRAFSALYNRYRLNVVRYVGSKVKDEWEAKAVFCDVWLKAMDGLKTFEWQGIPLERWLIRTANLTIREHNRKNERYVIFEEAEEFIEFRLNQLDSAKTPPEVVIGEELREEADNRFFKALKALKSPLQRQIIRLIYFKGITNSGEIAKKLGQKPSNIRKNHERALKKLKPYFQSKRANQRGKNG
jgi:RNA polymerase sigma-70 factor (ECF subfamily)